jgi:hypothetical protein
MFMKNLRAESPKISLYAGGILLINHEKYSILFNLYLINHEKYSILFNLYLRLSDLTCFWFLWLCWLVYFIIDFNFFYNKRSTKTNSLLQVILKTNLPFIIYLKKFNKFFLVLEGSIPSNHPPWYLIKHVPFANQTCSFSYICFIHHWSTIIIPIKKYISLNKVILIFL